jgi:hypothetical protein
LSKTRTLNEIRSLARSHTRTAINVLVGIMRSKDQTAAARVSAANAILDRGWGKATQPLKHSSDGALELIHRIERVIVHPEQLEGPDARKAAAVRNLYGTVQLLTPPEEVLVSSGTRTAPPD